MLFSTIFPARASNFENSQRAASCEQTLDPRVPSMSPQIPGPVCQHANYASTQLGWLNHLLKGTTVISHLKLDSSPALKAQGQIPFSLSLSILHSHSSREGECQAQRNYWGGFNPAVLLFILQDCLRSSEVLAFIFSTPEGAKGKGSEQHGSCSKSSAVSIHLSCSGGRPRLHLHSEGAAVMSRWDERKTNMHGSLALCPWDHAGKICCVPPVCDTEGCHQQPEHLCAKMTGRSDGCNSRNRYSHFFLSPFFHLLQTFPLMLRLLPPHRVCVMCRGIQQSGIGGGEIKMLTERIQVIDSPAQM